MGRGECWYHNLDLTPVKGKKEGRRTGEKDSWIQRGSRKSLSQLKRSPGAIVSCWKPPAFLCIVCLSIHVVPSHSLRGAWGKHKRSKNAVLVKVRSWGLGGSPHCRPELRLSTAVTYMCFHLLYLMLWTSHVSLFEGIKWPVHWNGARRMAVRTPGQEKRKTRRDTVGWA